MSLYSMYLTKTPSLVKRMYTDYIWDVRTKEQTLYLTFDDGPTEGVTQQLLDLLDQFDAKGTFFCIGKQIKKHPALFQELIARNHSIGNHTFGHVNGWKVKNEAYIDDVNGCGQLMETSFFRPPYGKIKRSQAKAVGMQYQIVMWDVLSWDFKKDVGAEQAAQNVIKNAGPGSIVVFHDSVKAGSTMLKALPIVLEHFKGEGYKFEVLPIPN